MATFHLTASGDKIEPGNADERAKAARKAIRRQAALAGVEGKRNSGHGTSSFRQMNSRKVQHIVFSLPSAAQVSRNTRNIARRSRKDEEERVAAIQLASPRALHVGSRKADPFGTFSIDFTANPQVYTAYCVLSERLALMDLRLSTHQDRVGGCRRSLGEHYAQLAFQCEPLFWSLVHNSAGLTIARHGQPPNDTTLILQMRNNAIKGINQELTKLGATDPLGPGLVCAIATLGIWERQWGTNEAWYAHRTGMELLEKRVLSDHSQHYLLSHITPIVNALKPGPVEPLSLLDAETGFARVAAPANLDARLVRWLRCCDDPRIKGDAERVNEVAHGIMSYKNVNAIAHLILRLHFKSTESDRVYYKVHILMQGAGVAMLRFVSNGTAVEALTDVDFGHLPADVTALAKEIATVRVYDEVLFWSMYTICALFGHYGEISLSIVTMLARRLSIASVVGLEALLSHFAFIASARSEYHQYWDIVSALIVGDVD